MALEWMAPSIPAIEVSNHADAFRIWCPDAEAHAGDAIDNVRVRAEHLPGTAVGAFIEQMNIEGRNRRDETIGVQRIELTTIAFLPDNTWMQRYLRRGAFVDEHAGGVTALQHRSIVNLRA